MSVLKLQRMTPQVRSGAAVATIGSSHMNCCNELTRAARF